MFHAAREDRVEIEMREFQLRHQGHATVLRDPLWAASLDGWRSNANVKAAFGSSSAITCTLASIAEGGARESTAIDNSTDLYLDALVRVHVKLQTGSPASEKAIYVYAYGSEDGTNYTDNATGSDAAITLRVPTNLRLIGTIAAPDSGGLTYKSHPFSVAPAFGGILPRKWGIVVQNKTNIAFSATEGDHAKAYSGVYNTVV
jgi:hypothetical protein